MASFFVVVYGLVLSFQAFVIISSNSFCIFVLRRVRLVNDGPKFLMMSLALADLLIGVIGVLPMAGLMMFVDTEGLRRFSFYPICKIIAVLMKTIYIIKVSSLLALNIDRYVAVTKALRYHTIMTYKITLTVTILIWIFSLIISVGTGSGVGWEVDMEKLNLCIFKIDFENYGAWLDIIFLAILPFLVTILIYIRLAALARHHAAQIAVLPEAGIPNPHNGERKKKQAAIKASKTFRITTFVFALSWVPLLVASVLARVAGSDLEWILRCCLLLAFCSGVCIILVYFMREKEFLTAANTLLSPKFESCQQFLADASARLQQFCCCACRACKDSPPMRPTNEIPDDLVSEVLRLSLVQDEVDTQPTTLHVQRNELGLQSFLGNAGEELSPHIKDSPL